MHSLFVQDDALPLNVPSLAGQYTPLTLRDRLDDDHPIGYPLHHGDFATKIGRLYAEIPNVVALTYFCYNIVICTTSVNEQW